MANINIRNIIGNSLGINTNHGCDHYTAESWPKLSAVATPLDLLLLLQDPLHHLEGGLHGPLSKQLGHEIVQLAVGVGLLVIYSLVKGHLLDLLHHAEGGT